MAKGGCANGEEFHLVRCPRKRKLYIPRRNATGNLTLPIRPQQEFLPKAKPVRGMKVYGHVGEPRRHTALTQTLSPPQAHHARMGTYRHSAVAQPTPINLSNSLPTTLAKTSHVGALRSEERKATKSIVDLPYHPQESIEVRRPSVMHIQEEHRPRRNAVSGFYVPTHIQEKRGIRRGSRDRNPQRRLSVLEQGQRHESIVY